MTTLLKYNVLQPRRLLGEAQGTSHLNSKLRHTAGENFGNITQRTGICQEMCDRGDLEAPNAKRLAFKTSNMRLPIRIARLSVVS
jgi:hypothetical protein